MAATVLEFTRRGMTALQWHVLKRHAHLLGLPILCLRCSRPHEAPPQFGRCTCGSYTFAVEGPKQPQLPLALDFHAGEV